MAVVVAPASEAMECMVFSVEGESGAEEEGTEPRLELQCLPEMFYYRVSWINSKVATNTNIVDLRTRHRSKLGWFFRIGPINMTIRRNLDN